MVQNELWRALKCSSHPKAAAPERTICRWHWCHQLHQSLTSKAWPNRQYSSPSLDKQANPYCKLCKNTPKRVVATATGWTRSLCATQQLAGNKYFSPLKRARWHEPLCLPKARSSGTPPVSMSAGRASQRLGRRETRQRPGPRTGWQPAGPEAAPDAGPAPPPPDEAAGHPQPRSRRSGHFLPVRAPPQRGSQPYSRRLGAAAAAGSLLPRPGPGAPRPARSRSLGAAAAAHPWPERRSRRLSRSLRALQLLPSRPCVGPAPSPAPNGAPGGGRTRPRPGPARRLRPLQGGRWQRHGFLPVAITYIPTGGVYLQGCYDCTVHISLALSMESIKLPASEGGVAKMVAVLPKRDGQECQGNCNSSVPLI